ncbi:unnamed protein product, partial [Mesorhabditis spiculigera]
MNANVASVHSDEENAFIRDLMLKEYYPNGELPDKDLIGMLGAQKNPVGDVSIWGLPTSQGDMTEENECEDGWISAPQFSRCYKVILDKMTFYAAMLACRDENSYLISLSADGDEQEYFLKDYFPEPGVVSMWIGGLSSTATLGTYAAAEQICRGWGSMVATATSYEENEVIIDVAGALANQGAGIWLGAKRDPITLEYTWADATELNVAYWRASSPLPIAVGDCLLVFPTLEQGSPDSHRWEEIGCNATLVAVCKKKT